MIPSMLRMGILVLSTAGALHAAIPDFSNINNCIYDVRKAESVAPAVLTFDSYEANYTQLLADLQAAMPNLPYVYQQAAAKPFIQFLKKLGQTKYLRIFRFNATDDRTAALQQIIPDAALAILSYYGTVSQGVVAFQEVVSDLYDGFLSEEDRAGKLTGRPIDPPTYGIIPPLVKFGSADAGPYTWPASATKELLGMGCGIVSLPPAQLKGGLIAWSTLGHETAGHDVTHADEGLLEELAQKVHDAVMSKFNSMELANYWASCIDESSADVCGYLNMGPSLGGGLIGYFRALGNGKLRTIGYSDDPHPIDLLRGYLAAAAVKRLHFKDAALWSQMITAETRKDNGTLYFVDSEGNLSPFPVSLNLAIQSTEVVAQAIMESKLDVLQGHSLQEIQDWTDDDQAIVDNLTTTLQMEGSLPASLRGPGFYAAYVIAASTQAALQKGAKISVLFNQMVRFLSAMHTENPTWSPMPTAQSLALLEHGLKSTSGSMR